ncbi:hypothetical protein H5410_038723 [Solanum commersonii]|uniref:Transmembrane protein n=1 Tax=Solanum commersonii TaxID=4109 RepID=A0A9J5Y9T2_SOLCO|nr:hypothetical protein H5410_038723 [Solanum commersonii]
MDLIIIVPILSFFVIPISFFLCAICLGKRQHDKDKARASDVEIGGGGADYKMGIWLFWLALRPRVVVAVVGVVVAVEVVVGVVVDVVVN